MSIIILLLVLVGLAAVAEEIWWSLPHKTRRFVVDAYQQGKRVNARQNWQ